VRAGVRSAGETDRRASNSVRVLLIEDHQRLASLITKGLDTAHIDVDSVGTVAEGLEAIATHHYDAALIDLGLPDGDGLDVLRTLREADNPMPVLILTSRVQVSDRVKGLNAGADDYVTKPFAIEELIARIHALLRRPQPTLGHVLRAGDLSLDIVARETRVSDHEGETGGDALRAGLRIVPCCRRQRRELDWPLPRTSAAGHGRPGYSLTFGGRGEVTSRHSGWTNRHLNAGVWLGAERRRDRRGCGIHS